MWRLHLGGGAGVGLLELQADDLPEFQFLGRAAATRKNRARRGRWRRPRRAGPSDAEGWALEASAAAGVRSALEDSQTEATSRARPGGTSVAPRPPAAEESRRRALEALDDLPDELAKKLEGRRTARGCRRGTTQSRRATGRRSSERRADETLDDVPSGAKKKKNEEEREEGGCRASVLRRALPRVLGGGGVARAAARALHRVAHRGGGARAGRSSRDSRTRRTRTPSTRGPSPPARTARTAKSSSTTSAGGGALRLGAVSEPSRSRGPFANEEGTSFSFAFDDSGRVTRVRASLGDARDDVAAEAETVAGDAGDAGDAGGASPTARRSPGRRLSWTPARSGGETRDASRGEQALALARLGDAGSLDPTDPDSEDYVAQMGSSPADTRKLWAQFAHLGDGRRRTRAAAAPRRLGDGSPTRNARRPDARSQARHFCVAAKRRPRRARLRRRRGGDFVASFVERRWARAIWIRRARC